MRAMTTETIPVATYSEALALAERLSVEETLARLAADDNPSVYEYRKQRKIAMDLRVHLTNPDKPLWAFVGFEYCGRKGYSASAVANLYSFERFNERSPYAVRPTVFLDRTGYFCYGDTPEHLQ